jgi:hypothetical protein
LTPLCVGSPAPTPAPSNAGATNPPTGAPARLDGSVCVVCVRLRAHACCCRPVFEWHPVVVPCMDIRRPRSDVECRAAAPTTRTPTGARSHRELPRRRLRARANFVHVHAHV